MTSKMRETTSGAADESDVNRVQDDLSGKASTSEVRKLERAVGKLQTAVAESKDNDDTTAALDQVDQRLDDMARQLRDLQANQQTSP